MVVSAVETWNEDVHTLPYVSEMDARRPAGNPEGVPAVKRGSQNDGDRGQFFYDTKVLFCIFSLDLSKYLLNRSTGEPRRGARNAAPEEKVNERSHIIKTALLQFVARSQ